MVLFLDNKFRTVSKRRVLMRSTMIEEEGVLKE